MQLNSYAGSLRELYRWGLKMTYASVVYGMVTSSATLASQMMVLVIGETCFQIKQNEASLKCGRCEAHI